MFSDADNIFRFEIPVYDSLAMEVLNSLNDLPGVSRCLFFIEGSLVKDFLVEVMIAVLHDKVDFVLADMKPVCWEDVRVFAVEMNLHFIDEIFEFDFVLTEGLDGHKHGVDIGNSEDDVSGLTLAHLTYHLQFIFGPFEGLGFGHLLQCLVHIVQFDCYWGFFLKEFVLQATGRVVRLQLFLYLVDVACSVGVGVANLFQIGGVLSDLGCWGGRLILRAFGVALCVLDWLVAGCVEIAGTVRGIEDMLDDFGFESDGVASWRI